MTFRTSVLALTLTSVAALTAVSANAADIYRGPAVGGYKDEPIVPVATWTGFYLGVNGGYAWSESSDQYANPIGVFNGLSPEGGFGGGQIGYNWQGSFGMPRLVLGIEADIQGADINDSASDLGGNLYRSKLDWFGTVRGRIGYAFDRTLVYGTGGFAYGGVKNEVITPAPADFKKDETATGYVVGGGVEYKIAPSWSLKAEYQYINLGKNEPVDSFFGPISINGAKVNDDAYHTVRVGLNYQIHQGYEPLK